MKNIAVLVSGGGTNLQALIDSCKSGVIKSGEIKLVISSNSTAYGLTRASDNNIKTEILGKKGYSNQEFADKLTALLEENNIDLIVLAGYLVILPSEFITKYTNRIVNVHPSLIPSFCGDGFYGLKVHEEALKYGVKVTGATVHYVNEITDGGEIILQKAVDVLKDDTAEILQKRVMIEAEQVILPQAVELICSKT